MKDADQTFPDIRHYHSRYYLTTGNTSRFFLCSDLSLYVVRVLEQGAEPPTASDEQVGTSSAIGVWMCECALKVYMIAVQFYAINWCCRHTCCNTP